MAGIPGMHHRKPRVSGARQRVWNATRRFKVFTAADLEPVAVIRPANLQKYLHALARAGVLRLERPKRNGRVDGHALWRLVRNSGPFCPIVRNDGTGVYDPNAGQLYPLIPTARPRRGEEDFDGTLDERLA